jgi:hypothetical protein
MSQTIFQVYSPDGFSIMGSKTFSSLEEAKQQFDQWVKRFENQGYYASNKGRISLDDLEKSCVFKAFDKTKCNDLELIFLQIIKRITVN